MTVLEEDGTRRCDATCHRALGPPDECRCICAGRNHGSEATAHRPRRRHVRAHSVDNQLALFPPPWHGPAMELTVHDRGLRVSVGADQVRVAAVDALAVLSPEAARGVADALATMGSLDEVHAFVTALRSGADAATH